MAIGYTTMTRDKSYYVPFYVEKMHSCIPPQGSLNRFREGCMGHAGQKVAGITHLITSKYSEFPLRRLATGSREHFRDDEAWSPDDEAL